MTMFSAILCLLLGDAALSTSTCNVSVGLQEQGHALLQQRRETSLGNIKLFEEAGMESLEGASQANASQVAENATFDEAGYQSVAALCCEEAMDKYIRRVITHLDLKVCNEFGLLGFVPWFACEKEAALLEGNLLGKGVLSYEKLRDNIMASTPPAQCAFVAPSGKCPTSYAGCSGSSDWPSHRRRVCKGSSATTSGMVSTTTSAPTTETRLQVSTTIRLDNVDCNALVQSTEMRDALVDEVKESVLAKTSGVQEEHISVTISCVSGVSLIEPSPGSVALTDLLGGVQNNTLICDVNTTCPENVACGDVQSNLTLVAESIAEGVEESPALQDVITPPVSASTVEGPTLTEVQVTATTAAPTTPGTTLPPVTTIAPTAATTTVAPGTGAEGTGAEGTGTQGAETTQQPAVTTTAPTAATTTVAQGTGAEGTGAEGTGTQGAEATQQPTVTTTAPTATTTTVAQGTGAEGTGAEGTGTQGAETTQQPTVTTIAPTAATTTVAQGTGAEGTGAEGTGTQGAETTQQPSVTTTASIATITTVAQGTGAEGTGAEGMGAR